MNAAYPTSHIGSWRSSTSSPPERVRFRSKAGTSNFATLYQLTPGRETCKEIMCFMASPSKSITATQNWRMLIAYSEASEGQVPQTHPNVQRLQTYV